MKAGDRIYYGGDRANRESKGTIVKINPANQYIGETVEIEYDEERFEGDSKRGKTFTNMFQPAPGRTFWLLSDWEAEQAAKLKEMQKRMKGEV